MLLVPTELRLSSIHGFGVFLLTPVPKGGVIWRFDERIDRLFTEAAYQSLPEVVREFVRVYGFRHEGVWILSGDNDRFTNHAEEPNTVTQSSDPKDDVFAATDLAAGTELTTNYDIIACAMRG